MITVTAFAACIGILIIPLLGKNFYNRALTFMSGIGVGSLSGSTMFIMLPQAFHITELGSFDYAYKSWMTLGGIYMLFIIDKIIKFFVEFKMMRVSSENIESAITPSEIPRASLKTSPLPPIPSNGEKELPMHTTNESHIQNPMVDKTIADENLGSPSVANMVLFGNLLINFIDGIAIGAAYADSIIRGTIVGIAIVAQQFPQEVSDLAILIDTGLGLKKALILNLIPAALSYIGFAIGVFLGGLEYRYDDVVFAIAAGMYFYICLASLIPEMSEKVLEDLKHSKKEGLLTTCLQIVGIGLGLVFMFYMALITGDIKL
uniref:Uncharacterized protein n=1 Tax=Plectus sambesii TaxID=2011161 RepID=A0A914WB32_9BILA